MKFFEVKGMDKCYTECTNVARFINNVNGEWRNSIYVSCSICKYAKDVCCNDLLVSFDADGTPAMISAADANYIFGTIIDKSECVCEMSNAKFKSLFEKYFDKHTVDIKEACPFLQAVKLVFVGK